MNVGVSTRLIHKTTKDKCADLYEICGHLVKHVCRVSTWPKSWSDSHQLGKRSPGKQWDKRICLCVEAPNRDVDSHQARGCRVQMGNIQQHFINKKNRQKQRVQQSEAGFWFVQASSGGKWKQNVNRKEILQQNGKWSAGVFLPHWRPKLLHSCFSHTDDRSCPQR